MLYDWTSTAALGVVRDIQPKEPLTLTGEGLWVCLISSGRCTASLTDASPSPAGSALILPPQSAAAGHLVLSRAPLTLTPEGESHLLCIQLTGQAAVQFLAGLTELPFLARGETCPAAAELLGRLAAEADTPRSRAASQLAFALLCELAGADSAAPPLPPLVEAAIEDIRQNYAGLYGVEELSERLGVSKSHLVRTFTAAVGVPPGRYLTTVRVEAAMRLLLHREYTLDVIASLCGFSGANYLCRVFKKETGQSPAQWRALALFRGGVQPHTDCGRLSRNTVKASVMASAAGKADHTPFMPNRALRISEQVTMAATPRLTEVMVASVGRLTAPR